MAHPPNMENQEVQLHFRGWELKLNLKSSDTTRLTTWTTQISARGELNPCTCFGPLLVSFFFTNRTLFGWVSIVTIYSVLFTLLADILHVTLTSMFKSQPPSFSFCLTNWCMLQFTIHYSWTLPTKMALDDLTMTWPTKGVFRYVSATDRKCMMGDARCNIRSYIKIV